MSALIRRVEWTPAYDKRPKRAGDPDYGIHGMNLRFLLIGTDLVTQFLIYTDWQLEHVAKTQGYYHPIPADLGYHSARPVYDGQHEMPCNLLPSGNCYYDGSSLNAERVFWRFTAEGESAVWDELQQQYDSVQARLT